MTTNPDTGGDVNEGRPVCPERRYYVAVRNCSGQTTPEAGR